MSSGTWATVTRGLLDASARRGRRRDVAASAHTQPRSREYAELKALVKARGLLEPQPTYYAAVTALCAAAIAAAAWWIGATRATAWVWLAAPLLSAVSAQLVLLGHEAAHRAIARSARVNDRLSVLFINVCNGGNHRWWMGSHNEHHGRANERVGDPDIDYPFFAFSEAQAAEKAAKFAPILTRQHWLAPWMMCFVGLSMRVYGFVDFVRRGARWYELVACASFYAVYPTLLLHALGLGRGALFIALHQALFGLYLGGIISVNHWGMPMLDADHGLDYLRQQATTSRNLRSGVLADLWFGGLNRQIEHHLFPTMARSRLRHAAPIVRAFCEARGVRYHEVSIGEGYREMFRTLARVARAARTHAPDASPPDGTS